MSDKAVLIYGGAGALGRALVELFKRQSWHVVSVDMAESPEAHVSVRASAGDWTASSSAVAKEVEEVLKHRKLNAMVCVAGGWAGGNAASTDFIKGVETMWVQSAQSSVVAAQLAAKHLDQDGLLVLTGATAALSGTPGMIGYGMVKAAVHQLVKSLGSEGSGLPTGARTIAILPTTLDTPMNRKYMADADFSSWTPLNTLSKQVYDWANNTDVVINGALYNVATKDGNTTFEVVKFGLQ